MQERTEAGRRRRRRREEEGPRTAAPTITPTAGASRARRTSRPWRRKPQGGTAPRRRRGAGSCPVRRACRHEDGRWPLPLWRGLGTSWQRPWPSWRPVPRRAPRRRSSAGPASGHRRSCPAGGRAVSGAPGVPGMPACPAPAVPVLHLPCLDGPGRGVSMARRRELGAKASARGTAMAAAFLAQGCWRDSPEDDFLKLACRHAPEFETAAGQTAGAGGKAFPRRRQAAQAGMSCLPAPAWRRRRRTRRLQAGLRERLAEGTAEHQGARS